MGLDDRGPVRGVRETEFSALDIVYDSESSDCDPDPTILPLDDLEWYSLGEFIECEVTAVTEVGRCTASRLCRDDLSVEIRDLRGETIEVYDCIVQPLPRCLGDLFGPNSELAEVLGYLPTAPLDHRARGLISRVACCFTPSIPEGVECCPKSLRAEL